jgi:hypothetical protein
MSAIQFLTDLATGSGRAIGDHRAGDLLLVLRPGFADVGERTAVHDWKFATRVEWLNGH